jgi:hydrogenase expression/formation protein HypD
MSTNSRNLPRLLESFRDEEHITFMLRQIEEFQLDRPVRFMEVCGGHTAAIYRYALHDILPEEIDLISGPGCPVCVTAMEYVDHAMALAALPHVAVTTFGDLVRVPGGGGSLADARANGADVRVVYSCSDAVEMAAQNPSQLVVFLGIGFETTACTIAAALENAIERDIRNFNVLSAMKTMPQALNVLLSAPEVGVDGLILPGHVTTVTGLGCFEFIARDLGIPCVVSGFEPLDLMRSIYALTKQIVEGRAEVANEYGRVARAAGNLAAQGAIERMLIPVKTSWRGLGKIENSGLELRPEFAEWNAARIPVHVPRSHEPRGCRCGEILRGMLHPEECPLMGKRCTPETPVGACMVSSEGACAAAYQYGSFYADNE